MKCNVVRDDGVHVCKRMCDTCIFRPGNLMDLQSNTVKSMVDRCLKINGTIPCHEREDRSQHAICRGFFNRYQDDIAPLRLAAAFNKIVED